MLKSQCLLCKHFHRNEKPRVFKCKAYPNGVPKDFLFWEKKHDAPTDDQEGDYVFEEIELETDEREES